MLQQIQNKSENLPALKDSISFSTQNISFEEQVQILKTEALVFFRKGYYQEALQKLEDALLLSPADLEILYRQACCLFCLQKYSTSLKILEQLLRLKDERSFPLTEKLFLLTLGYLEKFSELEDFARHFARENPNDLQILNILAYSLERQGKFSEAEEVLQKILQKDPENPNALNSLAYIFYQQDKNLDLAMRMVQKALKKEKDNAFYLDTLGVILAKRGNLAAAKKTLKEALAKKRHPEIKKHYQKLFTEN